jgi:hypothetical protein
MNYQGIIATAKPNLEKVPGGWEPAWSPTLRETNVTVDQQQDYFTILKNVIANHDCKELINWMLTAPKLEPVTVQGKDLSVSDDIGSMRATIWTPGLAEQVWKKIEPFLATEVMGEKDLTDWWQGDKKRCQWKPIGVSPMMRCMRYEKGGEHWAHYDAGFIYPNDNYRTLKSVVIYLTTSDVGGSTRFIDDKQADIPVWERDHDDWLRESRDDEVIFKSPSIEGNVLIFNHRVCHDVEVFGDVGRSRVIIRTDILYEAVGHE